MTISLGSANRCKRTWTERSETDKSAFNSINLATMKRTGTGYGTSMMLCTAENLLSKSNLRLICQILSLTYIVET